MGVSTAIKRLQLRKAYSLVGGGTTLLEVLTDAGFAQLDVSSGGQIVAFTSSNGKTVAFARGNVTPDDWVELFSDLLDLYDTANAVLISGGATSPTDAQIYAEMMRRLKPVRSYHNDFSDLRIGRSNAEVEVAA